MRSARTLFSRSLLNMSSQFVTPLLDFAWISLRVAITPLFATLMKLAVVAYSMTMQSLLFALAMAASVSAAAQFVMILFSDRLALCMEPEWSIAMTVTPGSKGTFSVE